MKQADDLLTLELPGLEQPTTKRGRGRPRKDDALTPAERAKRYRDRKKFAKRANRMPWQGPNGETWAGRGQMPAWLRVLSPEARVKCDHRREVLTDRIEAARAAGLPFQYKYFCQACGWQCSPECLEAHFLAAVRRQRHGA